MAEFDLSAILAGVSRSDTNGQEMLQYILYPDIKPDENNGYSMNGIEELARSIELVGLQQPLRVRRLDGGRQSAVPTGQNEESAKYAIVSGHRRHAAIGLLIEQGSKAFDGGVACIVDASAESPALRELKLLLGNADNRKMSSADEAQQAERISDCIRRLEDEGYEFPGRHRDWVAQLSGMSRTKLARLDAIRNNMTPELHECYREYAISEAAAYELQKLPASAQDAIAASCRKSKSASWIFSQRAQLCAERAKAFLQERSCPDGSACEHTDARFVQVLRAQYNFQTCAGQCCLKCSDLDSCKYACAKGKKKQAEQKAKDAAGAAKRKEAEKTEEAKRQKKYRKGYTEAAKRILPLIEAAGLKGNTTLPGRYSYRNMPVSQIRKYAAGDFGDEHLYDSSFLPAEISRLAELADQLGCTMDYLVGRAETPQPVSGSDTQREAEAAKAGDGATPWTARWHGAKAELPVDRPILTWTLTNAGEVYRTAIWTGEKFVDTKAAKKELTGLSFTRWIEIPEDGSSFAPSAGWVSVKDGLPPYGKNVLAVDSNGVVDVDRISSYSNDWLCDDITHWMDLPPLPGEGGARELPAPTVEAAWHMGATPPRDGRYLCLVDMQAATCSEMQLEHKDGIWYAFGQPVARMLTVKAWYPLPDKMTLKTDDGEEIVK